MLTTKLIVRVLDAGGSLLAWGEVPAEARGDGCLWASRSVTLPVECAGTPALLSVHWADVHVESRSAISHPDVTPGSTIDLPWAQKPVMTIGPMPGYLPPVTVRGTVAIGVPVGVMGARG